MDFDALPQISREAVASLEEPGLGESLFDPTISLEKIDSEDSWSNEASPSRLLSKANQGISDNSTITASRESSPELSSSSEDEDEDGEDGHETTDDRDDDDVSSKSLSDEDEESEEEFEDLDRTVAVQYRTPRVPLSSLSWPEDAPIQQSPTPNSFFADAFFATPISRQPTFAFTPRNSFNQNANEDTTTHTIPTAGLTERHENLTTIDFDLFRPKDSEATPTDENSLAENQLASEGRTTRKLEETLENELFAFSPEKRRKSNSGTPTTSNVQTPDRIRVIKPRSRKTPRRPVSPAKTSMAALLEQVANTVQIDVPAPLSKEERRAERRRRETRELRQFSEIDLSSLTKQKARPACSAVVEEQEEEQEEKRGEEKEKRTEEMVELKQATDAEPQPEHVECVEKENEAEVASAESESKTPKAERSTAIEEQCKIDQADTVATARNISSSGDNTESATAIKPKVQLSFGSSRRISMPTVPRHRRSSSVPLHPHSGKTDGVALPTLSRLRRESTSIPHLQDRIEMLEGKLEEITLALQIATSALHAERRARLDAESTREFLELERQFGVCCAQKRLEEQESRQAAVQLTGNIARPTTSSSMASFENTGIRKVEKEDAPKRHITEPRKPTTAPLLPHRPVRATSAQPTSATTTSTAVPTAREKRVLGQNTGNVLLNSSNTNSRSGVIRSKGTVSQTQKAQPYSVGPVRAMRRMENPPTGVKGPRR